jgi:NADP-dependent 3-hydroxy acid dehydrogenase YdfG
MTKHSAEALTDRGRAGRPLAVVTGASRGIGRAIALRLAAAHDILALARNEAALDELAREIRQRGTECNVAAVDVSDADAVARALKGVDAQVLVNNAGTGPMKPMLELTPAEWQRMVDVNFSALFHVTRALLPRMIARKRGHVVVIGSIAGRSAFVGGTCYAATKHAAMAFAESLMLEVRDHGVKVSIVNPGSVATEFSTKRDPSWMLSAEEVAESVAHVIDTPPDVLVHRLEVRALSPKK